MKILINTSPASLPPKHSFGLGDAVKIVASPIAAAIDKTAPLVGAKNPNLSGCKACEKRGENLNKVARIEW